MKTLKINVGDGYEMHIGSGISKSFGTLSANCIKPCRCVLVSDTNVAPLYLFEAKKSLESAGFTVFELVFEAGEQSKNMQTLSEILEFAAKSLLTRTDCVFALGGGVTGDISGFAAGCYMRGIPYIQLPTTLLAAVDSSVGGKTAVDLAEGKNLAGLFWQPKAVLFDTDFIKTLSPQCMSDGAAEAIKTGVLDGERLFSLCENKITDIETVSFLCASYKAKIVEADEKESGCRRLLNLGHTAAHAIEKLSGYTVCHGHAVAIGTAIILRYCTAENICKKDFAKRVIAALENNGLPTTTEYSASALAQASLADKKRAGDKITLVLPYAIGDCRTKTVSVSELEKIYRIASGEKL